MWWAQIGCYCPPAPCEIGIQPTLRALAPSKVDGFSILESHIGVLLPSYPVIPQMWSLDHSGRSYGRFCVVVLGVRGKNG